MKFITKSASSFYSSFSFKYQKPAICPHCGFGTDAIVKENNYYSFNDGRLLTSVCECTACHKSFFFACENPGTNTDDAPMVCMYPSTQIEPYKNENLAAISERFIDMYNQALQAEYNQNFELAAIGFRSSLEILVKDYAIQELGEPAETVAKQSLCNAIATYLQQADLVNTADVVRILGNDYTHYKRKYPEHDFVLLKKYMEIFLSQIEVKYMIKHPPVTRP